MCLEVLRDARSARKCLEVPGGAGSAKRCSGVLTVLRRAWRC